MTIGEVELKMNKWEVQIVNKAGMRIIEFAKKQHAEQYANNTVKQLSCGYKKTRQPNKIIITLEDQPNEI